MKREVLPQLGFADSGLFEGVVVGYAVAIVSGMQVGCGTVGKRLIVLRDEVFGLGLGHDLDHLGFLSTERDFVAEDAVFNWVAKWCVKEDFDHVSADEAHLDDSFSETTVS